MRLLLGGLTDIAITIGLTCPSQAQEKTNVSINRQPGILYLASHVMERQRLSSIFQRFLPVC